MRCNCLIVIQSSEEKEYSWVADQIIKRDQSKGFSNKNFPLFFVLIPWPGFVADLVSFNEGVLQAVNEPHDYVAWDYRTEFGKHHSKDVNVVLRQRIMESFC